MTTAEFTQNDVYTPEEANAFHEGLQMASVLVFSADTPPSPDYTPAETKAFHEGVAAGQPTFNETAYQNAK